MDRERCVAVTSKDSVDLFIEKRANVFAAAFLMPKAGVEELLAHLDKGAPAKQSIPIYDAASEKRTDAEFRSTPGSQDITYQDALVIARHFKVSYQAAVYRLKSLGYISGDDCTRLVKQEKQWENPDHVLNKVYKAERESANGPSELIEQIARLFVEAYRRKLVSSNDVRSTSKLFGMRESALTELLNVGTS